MNIVECDREKGIGRRQEKKARGTMKSVKQMVDGNIATRRFDGEGEDSRLGSMETQEQAMVGRGM